MADIISDQDMESIATSIFARHGVDFVTAKRAGGWTNAVWLTEKLVLRLSTTRNNENLLRETRLAALFPSTVGYPGIVETGRTDGFAWSLAARLPGIPLGEAWDALPPEERIVALQELWERAQGVHSLPVAEVPEFVPQRAWFNSTDPGEAEAGLVRATEAGILAPSESQVLRNALERFWCALVDAPSVLCHGDLTPGNAIWHAGHVTSLLDFEFAVLAPIQLDLNHLVKRAFGPAEERQGARQLHQAVKELAVPLLTQHGSFDLLMGYAVLLELWLLELWLAHPEGEGPLEEWEPLRRLRSLADGKGGFLAPLAPTHELMQKEWREEKSMTDDVSDIAEHYNSDPERENTRLERRQLEHDLTWCYLNQYLPAQGSILEVGAATGVYTLELAKRGYNITAVDLSAANIELCRKRLMKEGLQGQVQLVVADARDLGAVTEGGFDVALLMGPLYHLIEEADRKLALQEVSSRLRTGGLLLSSFISRFGIMGDLLRNLPDWIEDQAEVESLLRLGKSPDDHPRGGFRGYFAKVFEIPLLHEAAGFETLTLAGVEPGISADDESYNRLQGTQRQLWLDLFYRLSTENTIIGASRHLLYIGKKK